MPPWFPVPGTSGCLNLRIQALETQVRVEMKVNRKIKTTEQLYSTATQPELFMNGVWENGDFFSWTTYVSLLWSMSLL